MFDVFVIYQSGAAAREGPFRSAKHARHAVEQLAADPRGRPLASAEIVHRRGGTFARWCDGCWEEAIFTTKG